MKIKNLLFLSLLLVVCACSSDNDSENGGVAEKDALLSGTVWYYADNALEPNSPFYTDNDYEIREIVNRFITEGHPEVITKDTVTRTISDTIKAKRNPGKIIFGNGNCQVIDSTTNYSRIQKYSCDFIKYTFKPGTYELYYDTYTITRNGIDGIPLDNGAYYYPIEDNNYKLISSDEVSNNVNVNIYTYDFTRSLYDVVLSLGSNQFRGKLNPENGLLELQQTAPTSGQVKTYVILNNYGRN